MTSLQALGMFMFSNTVKGKAFLCEEYAVLFRGSKFRPLFCLSMNATHASDAQTNTKDTQKLKHCLFYCIALCPVYTTRLARRAGLTIARRARGIKYCTVGA